MTLYPMYHTSGHHLSTHVPYSIVLNRESRKLKKAFEQKMLSRGRNDKGRVI